MQNVTTCSIISFFNENVLSTAVDLSNSGHGASFKLLFGNGIKPKVFGGPLRYPYILNSFHMHWPSEHTVDGRRYDAEIHIVHYNSKYESFEAALTKPDGLAVFGVLLEVDDTSVKRENKFVNLFNKIRNPGAVDLITAAKNMISVKELLGSEPICVLSYLGSLTTPDCSENVTWMIMRSSLKISQVELLELRKVKFADGSRIGQNYRPIQPLNGRRILRYGSE